MQNLKINHIQSKNFNFISYNNEFWFSQKCMSSILEIKSHTINWHLKEIEKINNEFKIKKFIIKQKEGDRLISRNINHYSLESLFDISMRSNRLNRFNKTIEEIKKNFNVNLNFQVRPIKERNFKDILEKSLNGILDFKYQYKIQEYIVDFYFPKLNLCVEYDENHHKNIVKQDSIRENRIKEYIQCNFLRVSEGRELEGLNELIKLLVQK